jgi:hypothetical protein
MISFVRNRLQSMQRKLLTHRQGQVLHETRRMKTKQRSTRILLSNKTNSMFVSQIVLFLIPTKQQTKPGPTPSSVPSQAEASEGTNKRKRTPTPVPVCKHLIFPIKNKYHGCLTNCSVPDTNAATNKTRTNTIISPSTSKSERGHE